MTPARTLCIALACAGGLSCADPAAEALTLPESFRGAYARRPADGFLNTLGLEVDVDTLRYSEATLKILEGRHVGTNSVQVTLAELAWAQDDKVPIKCKGTIARQGDRLLLSLFKQGRDGKCDPAFDGDWKAWHLVSAFPEALAGTYGASDPYASHPGTTIEGAYLRPAGTQVPLELEEAVVFDSAPAELIVRRARFGQALCRGTIKVADGRLLGELTLLPSAAADNAGNAGNAAGSGGACPSVHGQRWSVDAAALPDGPLHNGKVRLEIRGGASRLTTTDEQGLRCEQAILRTARRTAARSGRDGIPVMSGTVVVLAPADPEAGVDGCVARLDGLAEAECEELLGMPCDGTLLGSPRTRPSVTCPTHLVIGDAEATGRKVALLPNSIQNAVCWETKERFVSKPR